MQLLLLILFITFMQFSHNYIPETNHVPSLYSVAAVLLLQCMANVMLFLTIKLLHCTSALYAVCVQCQCPVWLFRLDPCSLMVLSRYVARVLTEWLSDCSGCHIYYQYYFCFAFQMCCIYIVRSLYFRILLSWSHFSVLKLHIYYHTCSFFSITNYDVRFIFTGGSIGLHWFIP